MLLSKMVDRLDCCEIGDEAFGVDWGVLCGIHGQEG